MPVQVDYACDVGNDTVINVSMVPPIAIGGWTIQHSISKRYGGSGFINKFVSSGFNGASGITITNSGQGVFNITLNTTDTSELDQGAYYSQIQRTDSGSVTDLVCGFLLLLP